MADASIGIIGAGPAGLTAAYLLSQNGMSVDVWEADPHYVGGIARTVEYKGYRFDIGGHRFFSKSQEVEDLWTEILGDNLLVRKRLSRIFYRGQFYSYPPDAAEVVSKSSKRELMLSLASYVKAKLLPRPQPQNLEDWIINKFGAHLYRAFFKTYTEKVWGMPCQEIGADWAAQRIRGLSVCKAVAAALLPARPPANGTDRNKVIKTLISQFRYPRQGPGMMWEATAEHIRKRGGRIILDAKVTGIARTADGRWSLSLQGSSMKATTHTYDHVISSAPLSWLVQTLRPSLPKQALDAAAALRYRDFLVVALIVQPSTTFPDNWLYIHDPDLQVGRIQNFANWSPEMAPNPTRTCYGLEYFCSEQGALWQNSNSKLIALATHELEILGLAQPGDVVDGVVMRQPMAYPVYDKHYTQHLTAIRAALVNHCPGLHVVGRNGMHKYNNQDHSMMTAMLTARNILAGQPLYDVWKVNQDAEYIEEDD